MRTAKDFRTASNENYKEFCKLHKDIKITAKQFREIIQTYNRELALFLLETGRKLTLPCFLGEICINKHKPKRTKLGIDGKEHSNLPIDWKESKRLHKHVYLLNSHTDGYKHNWKWRPVKKRFKSRSIWTFRIFRSLSRLLASYLKDPSNKYRSFYREHTKRR